VTDPELLAINVASYCGTVPTSASDKHAGPGAHRRRFSQRIDRSAALPQTLGRDPGIDRRRCAAKQECPLGRLLSPHLVK
jgi:hypothetical protein